MSSFTKCTTNNICFKYFQTLTKMRFHLGMKFEGSPQESFIIPFIQTLSELIFVWDFFFFFSEPRCNKKFRLKNPGGEKTELDRTRTEGRREKVELFFLCNFSPLPQLRTREKRKTSEKWTPSYSLHFHPFCCAKRELPGRRPCRQFQRLYSAPWFLVVLLRCWR